MTLVDHPVLAHRVGALRDKHTDRDTFRQLAAEVTRFLAYEALRDLGTEEVLVDTPVSDGAPARRVNENVLVVPVLRAGLGMVQAIQEVVPLTDVAHVGLRRDEATLASEVYLNRCLLYTSTPSPTRSPGWSGTSPASRTTTSPATPRAAIPA